MTDAAPDEAAEPEDGDFEQEDISLTQPDIGAAEVRVIERILTTASLNDGRLTEAFEEAFAAYVGRRHAIAVTSGTIAMVLTLKAYGFGPGTDILCSPYGWHQAVHAVTLVGATPVFSDIDYWSHTLNPLKAGGAPSGRARRPPRRPAPPRRPRSPRSRAATAGPSG